MISTAKTKESRKHRRKGKIASTSRGVIEQTEGRDGIVKEISDFQKENPVESIANVEELSNFDECQNALGCIAPKEDEPVITSRTDVENRYLYEADDEGLEASCALNEINLNVENESSKVLLENRNAESADVAEVQTVHDENHRSFSECEQATENLNTSVNYNKILHELKLELESCIDCASQPTAPFLDISHNMDVREPSPNYCSVENVTTSEIIKPMNEEINIIKVETIQNSETISPCSEEELLQFYYNDKLEEAQEFIKDFIKEESNKEMKVLHPFFELLSKYLRAKNILQLSKHTIQDLDKNVEKYIGELWTVWNNMELHEVQKCKDGKSIVLTKNYTLANFNHDIFDKFKSALNEIKSILQENIAIESFNCVTYKLKIEQYIQSLLTSCPEFSNLDNSTEISLVHPSTDSYFQQCLNKLKTSIGILFLFQRKQKVDMTIGFLEDSRQWLTDLIAVLIRAGNVRDHFFILNHLLRCPGGVGKWGSHFIQFPKSSEVTDPFSQPTINHIMATMAIMLQPVEKREDFMIEWNNAASTDANAWVMIDSEDEDDEDDEDRLLSSPLKESDLVLLLDQIPLKYLFGSVLGLTNKKLNPYDISFSHLMKLFSFSSDFIKIIQRGLQVYSTHRYKQFAKRLGQLLRHIIEFATDELELYKSNCQVITDNHMKRLQAEYDNFFLKSTKSIYSSRTHGTWQFLSVVPYHLVSRNAVLELYFSMQLIEINSNVKFQINLTDFEEKFNQLPESEQFYLLSAFTSMALARDLSELDFIKIVVHQLLYIGFISNSTKDQCYKSVKSLLFNMCEKHPFLMSEILRLQNKNFLSSENLDQSLSVCLWKELPLKIWKPTHDDLQILSSWLLQSVQSVRSELARIILKWLNYGIDQGQLFLPMEIHRTVAQMILKACLTIPQDQESNVIKNVSAFVGLQEPDQVLQLWSWNVLMKLRLHLFDQSPATIREALENLSEKLQHIPELLSLKELHELVQQKNPIACFISLTSTITGHSVPLIFNDGFPLLKVLIKERKSDAAIVCLELMMMMFLECPQSLLKCQQFTSVLSELLMISDDSYLKLAKNLTSFENSDPIVLTLENMIQNQIKTCDEIGISRNIMIELWIKSLTKIHLWTANPNIIYLVNSLCRTVFFDPSASIIVKNALTSSLLDCASPSETKSSLASLVSWMNQKSTIPTLLPRGCNGNATWYFLFVIEIEQELNETGNFLWKELLKELWRTNDAKTNIDKSLKKACSNLKIPVRTSSVLTIYRLCYQILETNTTHPMVIILWQKFFLLYFHRVSGITFMGSIGEKFFDGIMNSNLFRRLKQRLKETLDCVNRLRKESGTSDEKANFYSNCCQVLHVFQMWLEEPNLHNANLNTHLLPPLYKADLFDTIVNHNTLLWSEYIDYTQINNEISRCISAWRELKCRRTKKELPKSASLSHEKSPTERIQDGVSRYEDPVPAPSVDPKKYKFPSLTKMMLQDSGTMESYLRPSFKRILEYCDYHNQQIAEYIGFSCSLQELVQVLYKTITSTIKLTGSCEGYYKVIDGQKLLMKCSGSAVASVTYNESFPDEKNQKSFNLCLKNFNQCLSNSLHPLEQNLGISVVTIEKSINELKAEYLFMRTHCEDNKLVKSMRETGIGLFYEFASSWSECVSLTPGVKTFFESCLDSLGTAFILDNPSECEYLLNMINDHPHLVDKLKTYFDPNSSATQEFTYLYSIVRKFRSEIRVVLLSRFDVTKWLTEKKPRFTTRSTLISEIGIGLKSQGPLPDKEINLVKLLNDHLHQLLMFDFPEHYGEIMNLLLDGSESQTIPVSTWFMFLNAIVPDGIHFEQGNSEADSFEPRQPLSKLKLYFTQYATQQTLLSLSEIRETILHLGNLFKTDRLKHGLCGLYPKYRLYVEPVLIFCGMMSHSYVAETLKLDLGSLSMTIAAQLWPLVRDLFSPWLVPYWSKQEKSQSANWIQDLTDRKCVLLPWVNSDVSYASYSCRIFTYSMKFVLDTLPGTNSMFSHIWFFYVTNYAHNQVKDYVLRVIHKNLLLLPWSNFFPTLQDIELMVKVVEHFVPMAHSLLGNIYIQIKWSEVVNYYSNQNDMETLWKLHVYLLHLLVKLPCEPTLKENGEIVALLTAAKNYSWHLVDSNNYDNVLNWFVMSCDPRIILMDEKSEYYELDSLILQILRICAGFTDAAKEFHPTTLTKRQMYVRATNKWLTSANSRFKCKDSALFKSAVLRILSEIESIVNFSISETQKPEEVALLLSEFLNIFKDENLISVVEQIVVDWLATKRCKNLIYGFLRSIALSAVPPETFGNISEACLNSYFDFNDDSSWSDITSKFVMYACGQTGLLKVIINNNYFLTLYAIMLKKFTQYRNLLEKKIVVSDIFYSLTSAKRCETVEPKLILLIIYVCNIAEIVGQVTEAEEVSILSRLSEHLVNLVNDKGNGFLSTLGLKKRKAFSNNFKFICLVAGGGIIKLLKTRYAGHEVKIDEKILRSLDQTIGNEKCNTTTQNITIANEELNKLESVHDLIQILKNLSLEIFNKNYLK